MSNTARNTFRSAYPAAGGVADISPADIISFHRSVFGDLRMEEGADGSDEGEGDGPGDSKAPWEKKGEEFDAEKAKTLITSLQRERDAERNKRQAAEGKVKEHEDAQLSETERLTQERDALRGSHDATQSLVNRYEVAEEVGLPLSWARRLVGDDREALLADAKAMKTDLDASSKSGPRPDPSQGGGEGGGRPSSVADAMDEYRNRKNKTTT